MKVYRQGDVLMIPVGDPIPAGATEVKREDGDVILAHGEITGHAHRVSGSAATLLEVDDRKYLRVDTDVKVTHEEHGTIQLPTGVYEIRRQQEYTPDEIRPVAD